MGCRAARRSNSFLIISVYTKGRELIRFGSRFAERVKQCRRGGCLSPRKWKSQGWASNSGNSWWVGIFLSPLPPKLLPKRPQMIPSFTLSPRNQVKQYLRSLKMVPLRRILRLSIVEKYKLFHQWNMESRVYNYK